MQVKPKLKAFLIADKVIQEKLTNKWSIIGVFDKIISKNFPCVHPELALYIRLTDAEGEYNIKLEFCEMSGNILSVFKGLRLTVNSKLAASDIGIPTHDLPLPNPGKYLFRLYLNEEFLEDISIEVLKSK